MTQSYIGRSKANRRARRIIRPALSWRRLSPARRAVAREAAVEVLRAWALVRLRPFASYAPRLGTATSGDPEWAWEGDARALVEARWAVKRWNTAAGGRFTCLMQAMAAQELLFRRGVPSSVVLGVKPGANGADPTAHAWLRVGPWVVLGGAERDGHLPVASYSREPGS